VPRPSPHSRAGRECKEREGEDYPA
jgi:hypothetical protein